ncbi:MAG: S9 family peptidase [Microbacteriaceae bacterium]
MQPAQIDRIVHVTSLTVSPDGAIVVFEASRADLGADAAIGQLWVARADGATAPRRLTRGFRDASPAFSPDGSLIAFVRAEAGKPGQLHIVSATGGEPLRLTDRTLGVAEFVWGPGSDRIAFTSREPENGRYGSIEGLEASAEAPRHITTLRFKSNGTGYIRDRRSQVFVLDVPPVDGEPSYPHAPSVLGERPSGPDLPESVRVTAGDVDHGPIAWTADGTRLVVVAARHDSNDTTLFSQLWSVDPSQHAEPTQLTPHGATLSIGDVSVTTDGTIFFTAQDVGPDGRDFIGRPVSVYVLRDSSVERLTDDSKDFGDAGSRLSSASARSVLAVERSHGRHILHEIASDGTSSVLLDGDITLEAQAAASDTIAVAIGTASSTAQIAIVTDGTARPLTDFSGPTALDTHELTIRARDGYDVHGWVALPDGDGPHPVLLMIHGGPFSQYGVGFFDETQVFAEAGYAVVYCNPRGSASYGVDHGRAIRQRMGTEDYTDVLDFLDGAVAAYPEIDGSRAGIMGGSYGGYLTAWTIAHDHRFAAAIVERGFLDPETFVGTSDIGDFFGQEYVGTDREAVRAQSPQAVAHSVTTPTFVIHSADDLRCPLGQAETYFATLKIQGVESELLIFPGENHELSRSGRPRHRVQRFEAMLDWWDRYLPVTRNR